jgi:hypothetical protein
VEDCRDGDTRKRSIGVLVKGALPFNCLLEKLCEREPAAVEALNCQPCHAMP